MSESNKNDAKAKPLLCKVTSDKMAKSRVGSVSRLVKHEQYQKYIRRQTKIMFHDEANETGVGDTVLIIPCKPYSARKKFNLFRVVEKHQE